MNEQLKEALNKLNKEGVPKAMYSADMTMQWLKGLKRELSGDEMVNKVKSMAVLYVLQQFIHTELAARAQAMLDMWSTDRGLN